MSGNTAITMTAASGMLSRAGPRNLLCTIAEYAAKASAQKVTIVE